MSESSESDSDFPGYTFSTNVGEIRWPSRYNRSQRAYILFFNKAAHPEGDIILTGQSSYSQTWSGFGGGRKNCDQNPRHTAIREVVEELFGWKYQNGKFSYDKDRINYRTIYNLAMECFRGLNVAIQLANGNDKLYVIFIVSFAQLEKFLQEIYNQFEYKIQSPFYNRLPSDVMNLIRYRVVTQEHKNNFRGEIENIKIIQIERVVIEDHIDNYFKNDIAFFRYNLYKRR